MTARPKSKIDRRFQAAGLLLVSVLVIYGLLELFPDDSESQALISGGSQNGVPGKQAGANGFDGLAVSPTPGSGLSIRELPDTPIPDEKTSARPPQASTLLAQAKQETAKGRYDDALRTLNRIRPIDPENPQAYLRIGEALIGKKDYATARDFFAAAIERDPALPAAYFGYAVASEGLGDLESALGGMRSYLHMEADKTLGRLPVAQARSAIWEWESKLGRGPWGPTKGIPPGFTAEEIKRDGRGTAVRMQKNETMRPDGTMDWEIKSSERFPGLWKP